MITVIANLKGGTGKSTVTFNLAVWLSALGKQITVIDLDPQRTLTDVAALRAEENIVPKIEVRCGSFPDIDFMDQVEETLIDVGTADLDAFKRALMIADRVLIPVTPSQADIWSTQRFVQFLYKITEGNAPESVAFINRADVNRAIPASDEAAAALAALPGVRLMPQRLSDRPVFRDSFSEGLAVLELEPRSRAAAEFKALATALFGERRSMARRRPYKSWAATGSSEGLRPGLTEVSTEVAESGQGIASAAVQAEDWEGEQSIAARGGRQKGGKKGKKSKEGKKTKGGKKGKGGKKAKKGKKNKKGKRG